MSPECTVAVRFYPPPPELQRYFTTFYRADIAVSDGGKVTDQVQPEWANLRFITGSPINTETIGGDRLSDLRFVATGPSMQAVRFTIGTCRLWGIGLLPLGWAKFVGAPADALADVIADGSADPTFARFASLARTLIDGPDDVEQSLAAICHHFNAYRNEPVVDEARILAIHEAIIDPDVDTVSELVARVDAAQRTVERVCHRAFGFSPKRLLRRQRFMRSLTQFMLDPSLKWIGAIDGSYHDQAQFVRDFREFMGMTPREYAATPHPILGAFMRERARVSGAAVQTLDSPAGGANARPVAAAPPSP
ncbi:MAG TPA: helix-turn-helix domain-containing protein [Novosphingobium sp.]|nr:helix-turn-helix domain-containing protein [Novosphingobium sp.]